ncbi:MAG: helix-turn-helix domain-containing protein [Candidatus Thiodiazotropha endolucinida]|nr:helix-turn-helix domain-containing protein [Candidatus Thiodiazotropha taylori]MCW4225232.1 helix-turn-helix domain-containing protein [Candidatus Thiodiazotropha endolucinida]MCG7880784.1 helix-turn-helix domain-containing protein [Candidatus Thiodiazotropha taylori]MCG7886803.1 helix-turn-helix domain-containing protein [Candidatus Thiodiazotropha taylori]MCG8028190.1 helix-turn-helix domain-containing protein [Candidatus Thiodiazotropha taylori]
MAKMEVTPGSENIFEALELEEAENLRVRALLMAEITQIWRDSDLLQYEMAERMKQTPARFNDVVKGRIHKCTVDRLLKMLAAVGKQVEVKIHDAA